jgi:hypothetical protein
MNLSFRDKMTWWALFAATALLFLLANRTAYKGYFLDDDLDTLSWSPWASTSETLRILFSPTLDPNNFRPVGHYYYHAMAVRFGLDFPKYIVPLQFFHLLNLGLILILARRMGLGPFAALAGALFWAFHAILADATWKPMYIFDVLCTTFSLLSLVLYAYDRWILSLLAFVFAFRAKELAIMLPLVLATYGILLGGKHWKRLIPFFAISLSFGVQALIRNRTMGALNLYAFHFTPAALAETVPFYALTLFSIPYAGLATLALPFLVRNRRVWFGWTAACLFLAPLLFLPGRMFAVYWYLPMTGLAIALAAVAASGRQQAMAVVAFLALWGSWNVIQTKRVHRNILQTQNLSRAYVSGLERLAKAQPKRDTFVWEGLPTGFHPWGVAGGISCVFRAAHQEVKNINDPGAREMVESGEAPLLKWDEQKEELLLLGPAASGL